MNDFKKQLDLVLYHSDEGEVSVNAYIKDETLWITQKSMAELFDVNVPETYPNICQTSMKSVNWIKRQLFPNWK